MDVKIFIDDSGKLHENSFSVFGALVFCDEGSYNLFKKKYQNRYNKIKCHYCSKKSCDNKCKEIKATHINKGVYSSKDRKKIQKLSHFKHLLDYNDLDYHFYAVVNDTTKIMKTINGNLAADPKRVKKHEIHRYEQYAQKRLIKYIIQDLKVDIHQRNGNNVNIEIFCDEQNIASNAYRNLEADLFNELYYGTFNQLYNIHFNKIFNRKNLGTVSVNYYDSNTFYAIQAEDLLAYNVFKLYNKQRNKLLFKKNVKILNLP